MTGLVVQQAINGLMIGSIYVLVALGMVLIYGVMHILNFSHGVLFTLAGYVAHAVYFQITGDYFSSVLAAIVVLVVIGGMIERFIFRPLRDNLRNQVVAALGLILLLQNLIILVWGAVGLQFPTMASRSIVPFAGGAYSLQQFIIIGVCAATILCLYLFLTRARFGVALRATSQNAEGALVVGVNVDRMYSVSFAIGMALAALGGSLLGPVFLLFPQMGDAPLLKGLAAIVLGGMGSVWGAVVGGLSIGLIESLSTLAIPSDYRDVITFALIIGVILLRPNGLFGSTARGET
jgi:branched-chain amino acid transport system permease protein